MSKNFPSSWGGGFSATKSKVAQNWLKWYRSEVKQFSLILGEEDFSATKTKVAQNWLKWIDLKSNFFHHSGGGLFCQVATNVRFNDSMKYWCVKLHHVPRYEQSISPKGRNCGGGGCFRPICIKLRFCQLNTVVFRKYTKD